MIILRQICYDRGQTNELQKKRTPFTVIPEILSHIRTAQTNSDLRDNP